MLDPSAPTYQSPSPQTAPGHRLSVIAAWSLARELPENERFYYINMFLTNSTLSTYSP